MTLAMSSADLATAAEGRVGRGASLSSSHARTIVVLAFVGAALAGFVATDGATAARAVEHAGGDLTRLLRAMAAIKAAMALGVMGAVVWRLSLPASTSWLVGYGVAAAVMAAGPGLIWDMAYLGMGALLLHGGLAACAILLWRDPAVGRRLASVVTVRRAPRR